MAPWPYIIIRANNRALSGVWQVSPHELSRLEVEILDTFADRKVVQSLVCLSWLARRQCHVEATSYDNIGDDALCERDGDVQR